MNFVPCVAWVPRGKAASTPHKLQLSPEELKRLVDETKEQCRENNSGHEGEEDIDSDEADQEEQEVICVDGDDENDKEGEEADEDDDEEWEEADDDEEWEEADDDEEWEEADDDDDDDKNDEEGEEAEDDDDDDKNDEEGEEADDDDDDDDFESRYNLGSYDNNDDENPLFTINDLAVHVDNRDDEYITDEESEGDIEEKEDFCIKESDNLLIVGHVEDSSSVLEIHVYNQEDDVFYVHHGIVLPSYPLSLSWLDFDPFEETRGNYVAVGDMSPVIKIWDLDVVDVLEPEYTLGEKPKKKKAKATQKEEMKSHSDAVLSLSWNKLVRNLLGSGSADSSVIVWDLEEKICLNQFTYHSNKVQSLEWHPSESQFLLSGCADGFLKLYDCRSDGESKSWKVDGEIEKLTWSINDSFKFFCSTDQGYIHSIDIRSNEIEHSFQGHREAVTGLDISPLKPDVLISASMDKTVKVWDLKNSFRMMKSLKLKVGSIYAAKVAPDHELTVAVGGNYASNCLKVLNIFKNDKNTESSDKPKIKDIKMENEIHGNAKFNKGNPESSDRLKFDINTESEIHRGAKFNKRKIYSDTKSSDRSQISNIKKEKEIHVGAPLNKRKIYSESSDRPQISNIKKEKEIHAGTPLNKRKIYSDMESSDRPQISNIKKEKEIHVGAPLNKRKIYSDMESSDRPQISNIKGKEIHVGTTLNKRKIYSDTESSDRQQISNIKKEKEIYVGAPLNKRKIYSDTEDVKKLQISPSYSQDKNCKRKK